MAAPLHASNVPLAAIPNVTLLEALWANCEAETDVAGEAHADVEPLNALDGSVRDF